MALKTISNSVQYERKIQRSTFVGFLFPIRDEKEAKNLISGHHRTYANATHNCYAYICGYDRELQYYSDAGEPHNTAGKPILNALLRNELTFVLAIVTRYFGGIKLGAKGLIDAYGETVELTIAAAELIEATIFQELTITTEYPLVDRITSLAQELGGSLTANVWAEKATLKVRMPEDKLIQLTEYLDGFRVKNRLDYSLEKE